MPYKKSIPKRRSIRMRGYDYSAGGCFFVTVCTHNMRPVLGHIDNGVMYETDEARIVERWFLALPDKYTDIILGDYIIMPNHFHCIIHTGIDKEAVVSEDNNSYLPKENILSHPTLGQIIAYFKYHTTKEINMKGRLWQRNYYEHIIRNEQEYEMISNYIRTNPLVWEKDCMFIKTV